MTSQSTAVATLKTAAVAMQMDEGRLIEVLKASLYPGAKDDSIRMVIGYCHAAGLDPMQKPVHIVPMSVKKAGTRDEYEWRDVVMPGIGLYRTQAARSGEYGGISEPEFGPDKELVVGDFKLVYPEWCRVTVKRIVGDRVVEFVGNERWMENYATAGRDTKKPNAMWTRRPYGQLAKCAEAQALRKAFPEIGAQPTAEEIQGKALDDEFVIEGEATRIAQPQRKSEAAAPAAAAEQKPTAEDKKEPAKKEATAESQQQPQGAKAEGDAPLMTDGMKKTIRSRLKSADIDEAKVKEKFGEPLDQLPASLVNHVLAWITEMKEAAQG